MSEGRASKGFEESGVAAEAAEMFGPEQAGTSMGQPVVWLNLLCLDAPLVAVSWQMLFARSFGYPVAGGEMVALFLTAWLIYLADRFGDSLVVDPRGPASLRQRFCSRHRRAWLAVIVVVAVADVAVVATQLERQTLLAGGSVGLFAVVYLVVNQARPAFWKVLPVKELCVGYLFAAGTMVGSTPFLTMKVAAAWCLFGLLCTLNCVSIAVWERKLDVAQRRISIATVFPGIGRLVWPMVAVFVASCIFASAAGSYVLPACLASSAVWLGILHWGREEITPAARTALADLVLLTPLVALAVS